MPNAYSKYKNDSLMTTMRCGHSRAFLRSEAIGVAVGKKIFCPKCRCDSQIVQTQWVQNRGQQ